MPTVLAKPTQPAAPITPGAAPVAAPGATSTTMNEQQKKIFIIVGAVAGFLVLFGIVYGVLSSAVFSAKSVANSYVAAKLGNLPLAFIHKQRDITRPNHAEAHGIIGDVDGRDCVVIDDMVDTAGTICEAVRTLNESGAKSVTLVATHGLLSGPAVERLSHCGAHEIVFMDTVPIPEEKRLPNMTVLSCAPLLAAGIRSVFEEGSVAILLDGLPEDMRPRNIYA